MTGLTSNPTIFDNAIGAGDAYDDQIAELRGAGARAARTCSSSSRSTDLERAAELFEPIYERTDGVDGWVSLEVSPLLADDADGDDRAGASDLHAARRPQHLHQDPRHRGGAARRSRSRSSPASRSTSRCCSRASSTSPRPRPTCAGIERRVEAGPRRPTVAVGRLAVHQPLGQGGAGPGAGRPAQPARDRGRQAHLRGLPRAARVRPLAAARQRGRAPAAAAVGEHRHQGPRRVRTSLYVEALAAPFTVNTMPEKTLLAFADHGEVRRAAARRRRRRRGGAGQLRGRRHRRRRARGAAPEGGRRGVREVVEASCSTPSRRGREARRGRRAGPMGGQDVAPLRERPAWAALERHHAEIATRHLRELFAEDPERGTRLTAEGAGLYLDYSKNRVTDETLRLLLRPRRGVRGRASAATRCSAASRSTSPRTAPCSTSRCGCRASARSSSTASDVVREVHEVLDRMGELLRPRARRRVEGPHRQARSAT